MTHDHLPTLHLPSEYLWKLSPSWKKKSEKQNPVLCFSHSLFEAFRAWNAINTNVKFAVVRYEVIQCYCYLTYKQLLSTNVNCHWNLELLYMNEINLPFRLAQYRILPSTALDPHHSPGMYSYGLSLFLMQFLFFKKQIFPWGSALSNIFFLFLQSRIFGCGRQ